VKTFLRRFHSVVLGVLHGFDRMRFRGNKRQLCHTAGMMSWLGHIRMPLKDYKVFARDITVALCKAVEGPAEAAGIYRYINDGETVKEEEALRIAAQHQRTEGLIAVLGCVEPCRIMQVRGNRHTKKLELRVESGKCKHYYHYYLDPDFGLRYTRLQSWFPFTIHHGLNGRDWLERQLRKAGIDFRKKDNCFPWVEDFAAAQKLANKQRTLNWSRQLERWTRESHPWAKSLLPCPVPYYWSMETGEYATDFAFHSPEDLANLYPHFLEHARRTLQATDLLRFMGYRVRQDGNPHQSFAGETTTRFKELVEGTCVKHHVLENLLKMYDKFGVVLRIETLLRNMRDFKVWRTRENDPKGPREYLRMRQGVADVAARAQVSQEVNTRYAESLATVADKTPLGELTKDITTRTTWNGRPARALNPLAAADLRLLKAVSRGEFQLSGFRNRDLRALLFDEAVPTKSLSAKVTRLLRLLRAHGLITKIEKTHRYQLTPEGVSKLSAVLAAHRADIVTLLQAA
jgi:hypothetical protein